MSEKFDLLLEEAVREHIDNTTVPPSEEEWEKLLVKLRKEKKKAIFHKAIPIIAAAFFIISLSLIFGFYEPAKLYASKLIKSIEQITADTFTLYKGAGLNNGNIANAELNYNDDPRLGEAQKNVFFKILLPEYLPAEYKLEKVEWVKVSENQQSVILFYASSQTADKNDFIQIMQESIPLETNLRINIKKDEQTVIKHIDINGTEAILVIYDNGVKKLLWDVSNINYKIDGTLDEPELVKLAQSMK